MSLHDLDYRLIDADNHFYEPDDCFTRHIEAPFRERTVRVDRGAPGGVGRFGRPKSSPGELFRRHVWVAPYHEEDVVGLARGIGAAQVLGGSDFPHPEGLEWPRELATGLEGLDPREVRRILRGNAAGLLGIADAE